MSWTDIRDAIQNAHKALGRPEFYSLSDEDREQLWSFAEAFAKNYKPETFKCFGCGSDFPWVAGYRCWDCKSVCCENCVKAHFGQQHQAHPFTLKQFEESAKEVNGFAEDLRVDLRDLGLTTKISERTKRKIMALDDFVRNVSAQLKRPEFLR